MNPLVQYPNCKAWLTEAILNQPVLSPCPACGVPLRVEVFPAFFRKTAPAKTGEAILVDGEASCFFHPQKKAVLPCDDCGRFVCALCDCEFDGRHLCPSCLEAGKTKGRIKSLDNRRVRYDGIALSLAVYPILLFSVTIITAPMALYVAIRYWKSPPGLVARGKVRFVAAIIIALVQLAVWGVIAAALMARRS